MLRFSLLCTIATITVGCGAEKSRSAPASIELLTIEDVGALPDQLPTYSCVDDSAVQVAPNTFPLTLTLQRTGVVEGAPPAASGFASADADLADGTTLPGSATL